MALHPSPVIQLNRAVALSRVHGPAAGLAELAALEDEPALARYYLLHSVAGRLHAELGDRGRATASYERALAERCTEPERRFLRTRIQLLRD
jgi:RNA polymerase sigma-70 factor (ECF subfamily)